MRPPKSLRLLCATALLASPFAAHALDHVMIIGWLSSTEADQQDAVLSVEVEGETCVYALLGPDGRFAFSLPVDARAELFFGKPGHQWKRIAVDTRNADGSARARRANRDVRFEVVLERDAYGPMAAEPGPVGSISFLKGTGLMKVRYHAGATGHALHRR
ncbi:MAG: hypothetical protein IPM49_17000 [Flavobacteriales bacterium]|nr:hypothetical protein [Flavobacteriales bacterium]